MTEQYLFFAFGLLMIIMMMPGFVVVWYFVGEAWRAVIDFFRKQWFCFGIWLEKRKEKKK